MATLRERRRQMLRGEILEAAEALIAEGGYSSMSMDELAARVGVSKPTLYNQFPTKEDLVVALVTRVLNSMVAALEDAGAELTPLERLCQMLHFVVQTQVEKEQASASQVLMPELFSMLQRHSEAAELMQRFDERVRQLVAMAISQGEISPTLNPAAVARSLYGLICSPIMVRQGPVMMGDAAEAAATVVTIFRNGVAPRP